MKQKTDSGKPPFLPTEASLLVVQFIITALALVILIAGIIYAIWGLTGGKHTILSIMLLT